MSNEWLHVRLLLQEATYETLNPYSDSHETLNKRVNPLELLLVFHLIADLGFTSNRSRIKTLRLCGVTCE